MNINFRDFDTKKAVLKKRTEGQFTLPRVGEAIMLDDGRIARVLDLEYTVSRGTDFGYDLIDVIIQIFEKDKENTAEPESITK